VKPKEQLGPQRLFPLESNAVDSPSQPPDCLVTDCIAPRHVSLALPIAQPLNCFLPLMGVER
jgi:hypothetical protein